MKRIVISSIVSATCTALVLAALPSTRTVQLASEFLERAGGSGSVMTYRESDGATVDLKDDKAAKRAAAARARRRERLREAAGGTYIDEILVERDSALARWPELERPLHVWIQPTANITDFTAEYVGRARAAFDAWNDVGLPGLAFDYTSDSARADVRVTWTDRFKDPISGRTRWARDDAWWITDASITLAIHHHQGEVLDLDAMRAMALHEVGHLIGLDHTSDPTSIMAPRVRVRDLSSADQATAQLLYSLPAGAIR